MRMRSKPSARPRGDRDLPERMGISVKLSALHPRYHATHRARVLEELVPSVLKLAQQARAHNLNFTVDAEEADRLELSLDVIAAVFADPSLAGWDGFGLAVQAYQKRAPQVIDFVDALCRHHDRKMMVRLVKGAYWDTEIKLAQERGLDDYPVYTRKAATDVSYLACARKMLDVRERIFAQFATHNALTVSMILEMAGNDRNGFEFQRLHGMGEALYDSVQGKQHSRSLPHLCTGWRLPGPAGLSGAPPAGKRCELILCGRCWRHKRAVEELLERPLHQLGVSEGKSARHSDIPLPLDIYPDRRNSAGVEFGHHSELTALTAGMEKAETVVAAHPLIPGVTVHRGGVEVRAPAEPERVVGTISQADASDVDQAMAAARKGFASWSRTPVQERAEALRRAGDLLEAERDRFMALLSLEAGKTLDDGIAEIREAVDFCRYYAGQAETLFDAAQLMPGPTGEENRYGWRGRGVFACVSPWNFPLAIFLGQVTAALAAGNAVIAKPAEQTPLIAFEAVRLLHKAGVPPEVLIYLPGDGAIGAALVSHPHIDGVAFTGSTTTARAINRSLAAKDGPIVPLIAETGGLNAMIVDATALPEQVADDVIMSAFRSAGQRCSALRLLYVQDDVADRMLDMIEGATRELHLGLPQKADTDIGPIIDAGQRSMLADHIEAMKRPRPSALPARRRKTARSLPRILLSWTSRLR